MRIIVITPEHTVLNETKTVNQLFANGLERLHLRKRGWSEQEYLDYIQQIDSRYHDRIVLHESFELAERIGLGGIHLNSHCQKDEKVMAYSRSVADKVAVSGSFHSWQEIAENHFAYAYVFISPVYDSISKVEYKASISLSGATEVKEKLKSEGRYCPEIIGLGGVGAMQIKELVQYGFDGAAMLGAIWESEDPVETFTSIITPIS